MQMKQLYLPRTQQQLKTNQQELTHEACTGTMIFKSHAWILLKALSFWELRHDEKWEEWRDAVIVASREDRRRKQVRPVENVGPHRPPQREYVPRNHQGLNMIANVAQAADFNDVDEGYGSS